MRKTRKVKRRRLATKQLATTRIDKTMKLKKKVLIYFLIIMLACTILGRMINGVSMPRVSAERPSADYVRHTVRSVGTVEKNAEEGIYTIPNMIVKKMHVNLGDTVKKDDTLLELDLTVLDKELTTKQNELKKIQLQQADTKSQNRVNADNRNRTIRHARESYDQTVNGANAGVERAEQELEEAKAMLENAVDVSTEERSTLESEVTMKNEALREAEKVRDAEVLNASQSLEGANAPEATNSTLDGLRIDEEALEKEIEKLETLREQQGLIKANVDGVVTSLAIHTGEFTGDTAIMLLADSSRGYRFVAEVSKEDNKHLFVGQEVSLTSTNGSDSVEKLEIESIIATEENPEIMRVTINVAASQFRIGESAEMETAQSGKQYSTCVPLSAIGEEDNETFLYVLESEQTILGEVNVVRKQRVTILDKNETTVAISEEGLASQQEVVVSANKNLQDGIRVRMEEL